MKSRNAWLVLARKMPHGAFWNPPESQQQLRDEKLISHQLPNNRVGTKVSVREEAGCRYLMLTIARSFKELLS
jgi:hypothetical protein